MSHILDPDGVSGKVSASFHLSSNSSLAFLFLVFLRSALSHTHS